LPGREAVSAVKRVCPGVSSTMNITILHVFEIRFGSEFGRLGVHSSPPSRLGEARHEAGCGGKPPVGSGNKPLLPP
jgi:hypothetical protein